MYHCVFIGLQWFFEVRPTIDSVISIYSAWAGGELICETKMSKITRTIRTKGKNKHISHT